MIKNKFKVGDKVIVCNDLITVIERIERDMGETLYWFKDHKGKLWNETEIK
tara:strand:+ start:276 stop:428 length:153 start_codon:yes stop_codon:yes gene_type:complete